jgi:hypothetical protein
MNEIKRKIKAFKEMFHNDDYYNNITILEKKFGSWLKMRQFFLYLYFKIIAISDKSSRIYEILG